MSSYMHGHIRGDGTCVIGHAHVVFSGYLHTPILNGSFSQTGIEEIPLTTWIFICQSYILTLILKG